MKSGYKRVAFTPELWAKWLARLNTPPHPHLEAGIRQMRMLLEQRRERVP